MHYTIMDDNVEAVPIYGFDGKAGQPIVRPCENESRPAYGIGTYTDRESTEATDSV